MKKKILLIISFAVFVFNFVSGQQNGKIPLDHSVYDSWKDIRNTIISNDGKWISYEINPQKGDGKRANQKDFTIRVFQYYNHFLKGTPAPEWMINGIPALEKGKNDGYKLMEEEVE